MVTIDVSANNGHIDFALVKPQVEKVDKRTSEYKNRNKQKQEDAQIIDEDIHAPLTPTNDNEIIETNALEIPNENPKSVNKGMSLKRKRGGQSK